MVVLILLAGLTSLSDEPQEAARIDGATSWQRFRFITLPLLMPTVVVAVLLRGIDALKTFDILYATKGKGGGSFHEVETLNVYAYGLSFDYNEYGVSSAVLIIFFLDHHRADVGPHCSAEGRVLMRNRTPYGPAGQGRRAHAGRAPPGGAGRRTRRSASSRSSSSCSPWSRRWSGWSPRPSRRTSTSTTPARRSSSRRRSENYDEGAPAGELPRSSSGNSLWVAFASTTLSLLLGVPAAYSMSRFTMKRSALVVLMARVIPGVSLLVPWYYVFSNLQMVGGYSVLILSHMFVALPLIVYIMMGYFDSLPLELEESALVDGLTPIGAFRRITLPLSVPGIATAGILSFIFSWNNFMFALVLSGANTKTLPVAIFDFVGYASIDWGGLMAAATVVTLPIMVIALFTQKYIVSGLTAGATKG